MNDSVRLTVNNELNFWRNNELVASGVPVPWNTQLEHTDSIVIHDEQGKPVPAQFHPLAWWQDGKMIKWLFVQIRCDIRPKESNTYVLKFHAKEPFLNNNDRKIAVLIDEQIVLDTGRMRCSLGSEHSLIDHIELLTNGQWRRVDPERGGKPEMELLMVNGERFHWGRPEIREIEQNGPEKAVIKLSGPYIQVDKGYESDLTYELRIEAAQGHSDLKLTHRLINHRQANQLEELSLQIQVNEADYTLGNGSNVAIHYSKDQIGNGRSYGVIQESEDEALVGHLNGSHLNTSYGRHPWWLTADAGSTCIMATVKHFSQRFPKTLEAGDTKLKVGLLPGRSSVKDSFLPANQIQRHYSLNEGESRTHEILLSFSEVKKEEQSWNQKALAFHNPMYVMATWDWYCSSGVLGDMLPKSDRFKRYEQAVDESLAIHLDRRESFRLYGDRNFGDDQYTRPGSWNNGEYDYAHVGMLHFLRGAGAAWFELVAAPYAKHMMDIDVCHSGPYIGKVHQHTDWHNSEPAKLGSHAWLRGLITYYCFTGNFFAKDTALMIANTWSGMIMSEEKIEATERGMTWPVISMLAMYDVFPEQRFLQAASKLIEQVLVMQDPIEGHFNGSMDRPTTKDNWGTFVIGSPVIESLVMYYQTTQDIRARKAVVIAARRLARLNWLEELGAWEYTHSMLKGSERVHNAKTDKMVTPAVLYGYLYSGDDELLQKALQAFAYTENIAAKNGKDMGQTYCFGIRIPALIQMANKKV
ncbi:exo-rhamnogalacturonan lyase family protein [Paenibacillus sp. FSL W7-1287]|uniref:exo-rhamnogalacturonan lyase family protein n=1 Tax=Paenibacillus sp. FSL W7-1287 TaxID=2954538 RepID=UPI0030FA7979